MEIPAEIQHDILQQFNADRARRGLSPVDAVPPEVLDLIGQHKAADATPATAAPATTPPRNDALLKALKYGGATIGGLAGLTGGPAGAGLGAMTGYGLGQTAGDILTGQADPWRIAAQTAGALLPQAKAAGPLVRMIAGGLGNALAGQGYDVVRDEVVPRIQGASPRDVPLGERLRQTLEDFGAGAIGSGIGQVAERLPRRTLAGPEGKAIAEIAEAPGKTKVPLSAVDIVPTENMGRAQTAASSGLLGGSTIQRFRERQAAALEQRLRQSVGAAGEPFDPTELAVRGAGFQDNLQGANRRIAAERRAQYQARDAAAEAANLHLGEAQPQFFDDVRTVRTELDRLGLMPQQRAVAESVLDTILEQDPTRLSYADLANWKRQLQSVTPRYLERFGVRNPATNALQRVLDVVNQGLADMEAQSPATAKLTEAANTFWRETAQPVNQLARRADRTRMDPQVVAGYLMSSKQSGTAAALWKYLDPADQVAMKELFWDRLFKQATGKDGFSATTFLTKYRKLQNDNPALHGLMTEGSRPADIVEALQLTERIAKSSRLGINTSGTAKTAISWALMYEVLPNILKDLKNGDVPGAIMKATTYGALPMILPKIFASRQGARALTMGIRAVPGGPIALRAGHQIAAITNLGDTVPPRPGDTLAPHAAAGSR